MLNKYNNICILYMVLIIYIIAYLYGIINHDLCQCFICFLIASIYCRKKKSRWHPIFYTTISNNGLLVTRVFCIICMLS